MATPGYHTYEQLEQLGEQIRDKAIKVAMEHEANYMVMKIHADHANDPITDPSGRIADDPAITQDLIQSYAHQAYDGIPQLFTEFATADPAADQPMIDALWSTAYALKPDLLSDTVLNNAGKAPSDFQLPIPTGAWRPQTSVNARLDEIRDSRLSYWGGDGADSFRDHYMSPLRETIMPQVEAAAGLAISLTAQKKTREAMHQDVWNAGQDTLKALDKVADTWPANLSQVLTVFTAAVGVLFAIPTEGWSVRGAYALGMAIKGFAGMASKVNTSIGGGSVNAVIASMTHTLSMITTGVDQQQQDINRFLGNLSSQLPQSTMFVIPPNAVSNLQTANVATLRNTFYPRP